MAERDLDFEDVNDDDNEGEDIVIEESEDESENDDLAEDGKKIKAKLEEDE